MKSISSILVKTCKNIDGSTQVLTGLVSRAGCSLTSPASDALVLTGGGGLGGCRWVVAKAAAAGEVKLTYSDWQISNWEEKQDPAHQTTASSSTTKLTLIKDSTSSLQGGSEREDGDYYNNTGV